MSAKQLGTMARPRGDDWLENEIKGLKAKEIDYLVSLLEKSEEWELGLEKEKEFCHQSGIHFTNFPIQDVTTPKNEQAFIELAKYLALQIKNNKKVVIHCRMGIGRSSMLAAAVMIHLGHQGGNVFELISKCRNLQVPDTEEQKKWLLSLENQLQKGN